MVQPINLTKRLAAKNANSSLVPLRQDIPNEAILRGRQNLTQALLSTVLALRPATAILQPKTSLTRRSGDCGILCIYLNSGRFFCLRTTNQPRAAEFQIYGCG